MRKIDSRKILKVAKTWLGTKFHYTGRVKINSNNKGGIDCIGLIIKVGEEINACFNGKNISYYDYLTYSRYPNQGEMKNFLDKYFLKISEKEIKVGDLVYMNFADNLEHIGILSNIGIIHCYVDVGIVVEHRLDDYWKSKIVGYYRYIKKIIITNYHQY